MYFDRNRTRRALARRLCFTALGAVVALGVSATALASHRDAAVPAPLRGLVTAVGSTALQLQTANGTVNVVLAKGTTHVVRSVMGSTADVTAGKRVDLHLVKGTRTVDAIRIEQNRPAPVHHVAVHTPAKTGVRPVQHRDASGTGAQRLSGQVVSLSGGTLTVRYGNGSTGSFTLGPNVNVNEALSGSLADLGVGETVQVFLGKPGNVARTVIIINA